MIDKTRALVIVPPLSVVLIVVLRAAHMSDFGFGFIAGILLALSIAAVVKLKRRTP